MRSVKNYLIFILACTTAGAGYLAWRQSLQLDALRIAARNADQHRADTRRRIWDERRTAQAADKAEKPAGETGTAPAAAPDNPRRGEGAFMQMLENPDYQTLMNVAQRGMLDGRYAALFKRLGLTPKQLEQFKDLLVEKQNALMDVLTAARAQGLDPRTDRDAVRQLMASTQSELDQNIKSAIGDQAYADYQNYEHTLPSRNVVGQLEERLSYSSTPLTESQSEQMLQILAETGQSGRNGPPAGMAPGVRIAVGGAGGGGAMAAAFMGGGTLITDQTVARAQTVLAPAQVTALQEIQQEQQASVQLGRTMRAELGGRARTGGTAPTTTVTTTP